MRRRPPPSQLPLFPPDEPPAGAAAGREPRGPSAPRQRSRAAAGLHRRLDRLLDGRLRQLVLTDSRSRIAAVRPAPGDPDGLALRLDACFAGAPREVLGALAIWIRGEPGRIEALERMRAHFDAVRGRHWSRPSAGTRRPPLRPEGRTLDLQQVLDRLNAAYFGGRVRVGITWGPAPAAAAGWRRRRRRSIKLGSYSFESRVIRVHPALDRPDVPRYVVEAVVYHELLHAALPEPDPRAGRRRLHPPEFRVLERRFPQHARSERWIESNLGKLLRRG